MSESENESRRSFVIPAPLFYMLFSGAVFSGGGVMGFVGPKLETEAITACYDNSRAASEVANQNGQAILNLEKSLAERTRYRYTFEDAEKARVKQLSRDQSQDRRLDNIERQADRHENPRSHAPSKSEG